MLNRAKYSSLSVAGGLKLCLLLLLISAAPFEASSQAPATAPHEAMRKLEFLVGEWKGKGWRYVYGGSRVEFSQNTKVRSESDGSALQIKDVRKYKDNGLLSSLAAPSATANIYYDEGGKLYRVRRDSSEGRKNPFAAKLVESKSFQWEQPTPAGNIRTTIKIIESGEWHETVEFWMGEEGWYKAEESVLKRIK